MKNRATPEHKYESGWIEQWLNLLSSSIFLKSSWMAIMDQINVHQFNNNEFDKKSEPLIQLTLIE